MGNSDHSVLLRLRLRCGLKLEDDEAVLRERNWGGVNNNEVVVNGQSQDAELISRLGQPAPKKSREHLHFSLKLLPASITVH